MTTTDTTTARPANRQAFTTTITPDLFTDYGTRSYYARRTERPTWTAGTLGAVCDVLDGWPAIIEVDRHTGHTVVGVIVSVGADYRQPQGWNCVIEYAHDEGTHRTAHAGLNIGTIVPMPTEKGRVPSRYDVLDVLRKGARAAGDAYRQYVDGETGGYQWYGKITTHCRGRNGWTVHFESQENDRYDATAPRKLMDGTTRKEYVYGPKEATFAIDADGNVTDSHRREHPAGAVVRTEAAAAV